MSAFPYLGNDLISLILNTDTNLTMKQRTYLTHRIAKIYVFKFKEQNFHKKTLLI
jgi:hypothetical protein